MKNCQTCRGSLGFQDKFSSQKSKNADSNIYLLNTPVTARTVNLLCMLNRFVYLLKLHAFAEALKKLYMIQTNGKLDFVAAIYALAKYKASISTFTTLQYFEIVSICYPLSLVQYIEKIF